MHSLHGFPLATTCHWCLRSKPWTLTRVYNQLETNKDSRGNDGSSGNCHRRQTPFQSLKGLVGNFLRVKYQFLCVLIRILVRRLFVRERWKSVLCLPLPVAKLTTKPQNGVRRGHTDIIIADSSFSPLDYLAWISVAPLRWYFKGSEIIAIEWRLNESFIVTLIHPRELIM